MDETFFKDKCLKLAVVTGNIDCKFWLSDGLVDDVSAVRQLVGKKLSSAVRGKPTSWTIRSDMILSDKSLYSTDFGQVCPFWHVRLLLKTQQSF